MRDGNEWDPVRFPRIFHQTWKRRALPTRFAHWRHSCVSLHPTWEHRLWTDSQLRQFVQTEYNDFLPAYDAYPKEIMRVDAVRYMWMHHFGGVYADLDVECLR